MNYTLHQLQIFLKICEFQSVTKASEALHLTQPAVSIQLKNLQDQFEIPLTEVIGRQLYVTDFGWEIARAARKIIYEVNAVNDRVLEYRGILAGKLNISVVSTGKYVMPYFLSDFIHAQGGVELAMDVTNRSSVIGSLERNEVDFSLVSLLPDKLLVENEELMDNELLLVGSPKLVGKARNLTRDQLKKFPWIFREPGSATLIAMEKFLESRDVVVPRKLELTSNEAVKQAVLAGLGLSIMPRIGIRNEMKNGNLVQLNTKGLPIITRWNLVWLKGKRLSPAARAFLEYIREEKQRIIKEYFEVGDQKG